MSKAPRPKPSPPARLVADKARIISFSDNVISIAITLLVLDVVLPVGLEWKHPTAFQMLHELGPSLMAFFLSFAMIGVFQVAHHLLFNTMEETDRVMLWINNLWLMFITLLPASAKLLSEFHGERGSVQLYGLNLVCVSISLLLMHHHSVRYHAKHDLTFDEVVRRRGYRRIVIGLILYSMGLGLACFNAWAGLALYAIVPIAYALLQVGVNLPPAPGLEPIEEEAVKATE